MTLELVRLLIKDAWSFVRFGDLLFDFFSSSSSREYLARTVLSELLTQKVQEFLRLSVKVREFLEIVGFALRSLKLVSKQCLVSLHQVANLQSKSFQVRQFSESYEHFGCLKILKRIRIRTIDALHIFSRLAPFRSVCDLFVFHKYWFKSAFNALPNDRLQVPSNFLHVILTSKA